MKAMLHLAYTILQALGIATALLASPAAYAAVTYKWIGTVDSNWQTVANWDAVAGQPPSGTPTSTDTLKVANGTGAELVYTNAEGTNTFDRFIISNGKLILNGGSLFLTNTANTVSSIGDFNTGGTLTINGGLINFATWDALYVNANGMSNCVFNMTGGKVSLFRMEMRGGTRGGSATVNLDGGTMEINQPIPPSGTSNNNTFNFNGGVLKAFFYGWTYSATPAANYAFSASPSNVRNGGAIFDTFGKTCYIQSGLRHSPISGDADTDGGVTKNGAGTLILMGTNTYTGATTVNTGTLTCRTSSEMRFALKSDFTCNKVRGAGTVNFNGLFRIAPASEPALFGEWQLVDVATLTETYHSSTFGLAFVNGPAFTNKGNGIYTSSNWKFSTATGILTRTPIGTVVAIR